MNLKYFSFLFFFLICSVDQLLSQTDEMQNARIMFYNVENLFNPVQNEGKNDEEFLPDGERRWTHFRKQRKQNKISQVILFSGQWNPPVLVGLCEVEDRKVLEELVWNTGLNHLSYFIEHYESADNRGIDVALLYRKDRFSVMHSYPVRVLTGEGNRPTRDILYVCGVLDQKDTLHVMVNHWPSRWGGEIMTRPKRLAAANVLKELCDSVIDVSPKAKIIAMGDFNDGPSDQSLKIVSRTHGDDHKLLINLAHTPDGTVPGTIKYKHEWSCFDQILVSKPLYEGSFAGGFVLKEKTMKIVDADFLLEKDPQYPGLRLKRTYIGFKYAGGYSDHLPVMIELTQFY